MSLIPVQIPRQSFEIILDRIGEILSDEIINQKVNGWIEDVYWGAESAVWVERWIPFDKTEVPCVNVSLDKGDYEMQTPIETDAIYRYNIDCYAFAKSDEDAEGDADSMIRLHRLMGVCRAILENPRYKTLGFAAPFIENRHFESLGKGTPNKQDALSQTFGRLTFAVRVLETTELDTPSLIRGYDTTVKLELTDKGYRWQRNNY